MENKLYDVILLDDTLGVFDGKNKIGEVEIPADMEESFVKIPEKKGFYDENGNLHIIRTPLVHCHTDGSMLDGGMKPATLAEHCDYVAAITDHGSMTATFAFWTAMKEAGKKPIIGCEVYSNSLVLGTPAAHHMILLAMNDVGYHNLISLLSEAEENFYRKPQVNVEILEKYSEGLIATSACLGGELAVHIRNGRLDEAEEFLDIMDDIFGDNFYLEVQRHGIEGEEMVNDQIFKFAKERGMHVIATPDCHYADPEDKFAHEVLVCIGTHSTIKEKHFSFEGDNYHIPTPDEFEDLWSDHPEVFKGLFNLIEKCSFDFETGKLFMPEFKCPDGMSQDEYFCKLVHDGFDQRFADGFSSSSEEMSYKDRLEYEIKVILQMGFSGYFLIVQDYIAYARSIGGFVGPGRGSAVGSLVAYCLGITSLDPLPYGLLFERFLNPERVTMPDIDVDFDVEVRDKVVQYCRDKYGDASVGKIITFGTLSARTALRDVGRVLDVDLQKVGRFAKAVPAVPKITLKKALAESKEFKTMYDSDPELKNVFDIAVKLEGLNRHRSVHACGVVISAEEVGHYVPEVLVTDKDTKEKVRVTSFTGPELESLGLLKMDFLGLRNMSVIKDVCQAVPTLPQDGAVPTDDPYVYKMISKGKTIGVFQVESSGMRKLMKEMFWDVSNRISEIETKYGCKGYADKAVGPTKMLDAYNKDMKVLGKEMFERLIAAISLFRPGPMDYIPQYLEGMRNPKSIHYDCPALEPILSRTYGVICYQEQVQEICRTLAGYTLGRADIIRRAMGKKKQKVMDAEKEIFLHGNATTRKADEALVPGCVANGISEEVAQIVWDKMATFAKYAFNKSHSAGYAVISATTGYLKLYHPAEFIVANLNSVLGKAEEIQVYLNEARALGLKVLPANVNTSSYQFTLEGKDVRVGLMGLKNLGKVSQEIISQRKGAWKSIEDFILSVREVIDKRAIESLALAGALDDFGIPRKVIYEHSDDIADFLQKMRKYYACEEGIGPKEVEEIYVRLNKADLSDTEEFTSREKLAYELERCGMYITAHPLDGIEDYLIYKNVVPISAIKDKDNSINTDETGEEDETVSKSPYEGKFVNVVGTAQSINQITTKKGDLMLMFHLEDRDGNISVTVFPKTLQGFLNGTRAENTKKFNGLSNGIIMVNGRVETDSWGTKIIASSLTLVDEDMNYSATSVFVSTQNKKTVKELTDWVNSMPSSDDGTQVIMYYTIGATSKAASLGKIKMSLTSFLTFKAKFSIIPNPNTWDTDENGVLNEKEWLNVVK